MILRVKSVTTRILYVFLSSLLLHHTTAFSGPQIDHTEFSPLVRTDAGKTKWKRKLFKFACFAAGLTTTACGLTQIATRNSPLQNPRLRDHTYGQNNSNLDLNNAVFLDELNHKNNSLKNITIPSNSTTPAPSKPSRKHDDSDDDLLFIGLLFFAMGGCSGDDNGNHP